MELAITDDNFKNITDYRELLKHLGILNFIENGVFIWRLDEIGDPGSLKIIFANPAVIHHSGRPPEFFIGKTVKNDFKSMKNYGLDTDYAEIISTGKSKTFYEQYYHLPNNPDIKDSYWNIYTHPLPDRCLMVVFENITKRKKLQDELTDSNNRLRFLFDSVSYLLETSGDYRANLNKLAEVLVPFMGDWCAIDMVTEGIDTERLSVVHQEPEKVKFAYELQQKYPSDPNAPYGIYNVIRTGKPELVEVIPAELLEKSARNEEHRKIIFSLGLHSYMIVPLIIRDKVLGTISLITSESKRVYTPKDLELLQDLASRAAMMIEHSQMMAKTQELNEQLNIFVEELQRSNEYLEQFAYIASHDLQEPLRSISGYAQLLEKRYKDRLDADADRFISRMVINVERMQALIFTLLEYSRVGSGESQFEDCNLNELLENVVFSLKALIDETEADIKYEKMPVIKANSIQLFQLFENLVSNAVKYRSEDKPVVRISCERTGKNWKFAVKDNGIGIKKEYSDKVFQIFKRLHNKEKYPGTGIGLSICKKIVEKHGGKIWLESDGKSGTTFYFTINTEGNSK